MDSPGILVHYGHYWDASRFYPIVNRDRRVWTNKPWGGLWTSPVNSEYGWKECQIDNEYYLSDTAVSFKVKLNDNSRILLLQTVKDIQSIKTIDIHHKTMFDYENIAKSYDAIWVTNSGWMIEELYDWDCETVLILNTNCFTIIAGK